MKLLHNGYEIKEGRLQHEYIQKGHQYAETYFFQLENPTEDEIDTYTCVTETGRAVSEIVGAETVA